jgi:hypothetical protein
VKNQILNKRLQPENIYGNHFDQRATEKKFERKTKEEQAGQVN